ncbi:MAG: hypothetical protein ACKOBR_09950 [Actinomycetota bacterium]
MPGAPMKPEILAESRRCGIEHRLAHRLLFDVAHLFLLPSGL